MKNKKLSTKILSFIMTFLVLAISLPIYAFASAIDTKAENEETIEETINSAQAISNELYVLEEDVSLREENAKHFKLSDGTMKAVSYAQAVHYKDENGNWIDIDNSLTLSGSEYATSNKQKIKFANKSGSNGLISIKDGEYKIDFTPLNTNKVSVEIENPEENNSRKFDDVKKLNKLVSKATYKDIYSGIDLEYILVGNNIKENIIVKEKQSEYSFSFEIKLNKLNAELENNAIVLTDSKTGEKVYEIPAPYMLDANGEYSDSVEYTLTKDSKWKYTLTVIADPSWINAEEREFPVKIDPTFIEYNSVIDITVAAEHVKTGNEITKTVIDVDDSSALIVGNFLEYYYDTVSFMKITELPNIPDGSNILSANLMLYVYNDLNSTQNDIILGVYKAESDWTSISDQVINQEYSAFKTYCPEEEILGSKTITDYGMYECDITSLFNSWKTEGKNYGVCLKGMNLPADDNNSSTSENMSIYIASNENKNYVVPNLEVTYIHAIGFEDYYAYAENTLGDVGKSYVNLYNGSLTYINKLTSIEVGENLTYDINMVYNSIDKAWTPSFAESIKIFEDDGKTLYGKDTKGKDIGIERYLWKDSDGTYHAFSPYVEKNIFGAYMQFEIDADGEKTGVIDPVVFYPEDDIDYVLIQTENDELILRDYQGNQKMFDKDGRLSKICDAQGNVIHINNYSGENNMASIYKKDSDGNIIFLAEFYYLTSRRISHINDIQNQKKIQFSWGDVGVANISYKNFNEATQYRQINFVYNDLYETDLAYVLDKSINQKLSYHINEKEDEDASNDEIIIESININGTEEETTKKYIVGKGFYKDLGQDLIENTNDDLSEYVTFDEKGREIIEDHTYNDELGLDTIYFSILYSQNIYNEGFNLIKYNMKSKETDFLNLDIQEISDTSSINTDNVAARHETVSNTQVSPYNMVCQILEYYDGMEQPYLSTGFLCGVNTIIMSGHSVREDLSNNSVRDFNFPQKIEVVPGRYLDENDEPVTPYGVYEVTSFYISKDYYYILDETDSSATEFDWAVCTLDRNVDENLGCFDIMVAPDEVSEQYIELLGYYNEKMRSSTGWITNESERRIFYNAPTNNEISGSPIFFNDGNYIVFGIHTTGSNGATGRGGTRINSLIYNLVEFLNN